MFADGMRPYKQGRWQDAARQLDIFVTEECRGIETGPHCKEARLNLADARLHLREPRLAFQVLDKARQDDPHTDAFAERSEQLEQEAHAQMVQLLHPGTGRGWLRVRITSQTQSRMRFLRLTLALDLRRLHGGNGRVDEKVASIDIPAMPVPSGEHIIDVITLFQGTGSIDCQYRFTASSHQTFSISDGDSLDVTVNVSETPGWTSWQDGLRISYHIRNLRERPPGTSPEILPIDQK